MSDFDTGRQLDAAQLLNQIGNPNLLAITGGRRGMQMGPSAIRLPVSNGFHVYVWLEANDTYRVESVFERSGKRHVKWCRTDVFAQDIGQVAYEASCNR